MRMTMMEEAIGADLKTNKSQCRELNSGPLPYQRRYKDISENILKEKVSKHLFDTLKYKSYVGY